MLRLLPRRLWLFFDLMMKADPIGLYLHVPFCVKKCNYCDFCSYPLESSPFKSRYVDTLLSEIASYSGRGISVDSVFMGGGTPSLLDSDEFVAIVKALRNSFDISGNAEFTVEANPGTLTEEKLVTYLDHGINRISMGLQSIHENELKILGRIHSYKEFLASYQLTVKCGFENINVDLMYGIPEQTRASFRKTLTEITKLSPAHISVYGLIIEEGTPFWQLRDNLTLPDPDMECDMYFDAAEILSRNGYRHYEISNYAKVGKTCVHNMKYWTCGRYIGLGVSAYSYFDDQRYGNSRDINKYLERAYEEESSETIDREAQMYEYIMLHLRIAEGFSLADYRNRFGVDFINGREKTIERLIKAGYLICDDAVRLTERGFYVSNSIINELT